MAKFTVGKGLTEYIQKLGNLEYRADGIAGLAIYDGAKIVADQIHANIAALPTSGKSDRGRRNPTQEEKNGLLEGLGIAKLQRGSFINVKIGMDGYNNDKTENWPNGKPNAMIARSVEAGNTFMQRNPFISKAVSATRKAAEAAMAAKIDIETEKTMK